MVKDDRARQGALRELRVAIEEFNIAYARAIDDDEIETWPAFFTEDGAYQVISRENRRANLPAGILQCEGRGMLVDRIVAIRKTMVYAPRTVRHFISNVTVVDAKTPGDIAARANFMIVESLRNQDTVLAMTGEYLDRFARAADDTLLLRERCCVYDSMKLRASVVYPI